MVKRVHFAEPALLDSGEQHYAHIQPLQRANGYVDYRYALNSCTFWNI